MLVLEVMENLRSKIYIVRAVSERGLGSCSRLNAVCEG